MRAPLGRAKEGREGRTGAREASHGRVTNEQSGAVRTHSTYRSTPVRAGPGEGRSSIPAGGARAWVAGCWPSPGASSRNSICLMSRSRARADCPMAQRAGGRCGGFLRRLEPQRLFKLKAVAADDLHTGAGVTILASDAPPTPPPSPLALLFFATPRGRLCLARPYHIGNCPEGAAAVHEPCGAWWCK